MSILIKKGKVNITPNTSINMTGKNSELSHESSRFVFSFPGSGVQYPGMGNDLYRTSSGFKVAIDKCRQIVSSLGGFDVAEAILSTKDNTKLTESIGTPGRSGICIFSYQYAITQMLAENGIFPTIVFGHSFGEYSAAVTAGALSLRDGLTLVYHRGKMLDSLKGTGAMIIVAASVRDVRPLLMDGTQIVAINGPNSTGVAGNTEKIDQLCSRLVDIDYAFHKIRFGSASHCRLVDPILEEFEALLKKISPMPSSCEWYSTYKNAILPIGFVPDSAYWVGQLRSPVYFAQAVSSIYISDPHCTFIEIGPQNGLSSLISSTAPTARVIPLSVHASDDREESLFLASAINEIRCISEENGNSMSCESAPSDYQSDIEYVVIQVWLETLKLRRISRSDNFFEIGGNSILASRIISDLGEMFGLKLPSNLISQNSTAAALATALAENSAKSYIDADIVAGAWRMAYENTEEDLAESVGHKLFNRT